jgi:hypothetical protein
MLPIHQERPRRCGDGILLPSDHRVVRLMREPSAPAVLAGESIVRGVWSTANAALPNCAEPRGVTAHMAPPARAARVPRIRIRISIVDSPESAAWWRNIWRGDAQIFFYTAIRVVRLMREPSMEPSAPAVLAGESIRRLEHGKRSATELR